MQAWTSAYADMDASSGHSHLQVPSHIVRCACLHINVSFLHVHVCLAARLHVHVWMLSYPSLHVHFSMAASLQDVHVCMAMSECMRLRVCMSKCTCRSHFLYRFASSCHSHLQVASHACISTSACPACLHQRVCKFACPCLHVHVSMAVHACMSMFACLHVDALILARCMSIPACLHARISACPCLHLCMSMPAWLHVHAKMHMQAGRHWHGHPGLQTLDFFYPKANRVNAHMSMSANVSMSKPSIWMTYNHGSFTPGSSSKNITNTSDDPWRDRS